MTNFDISLLNTVLNFVLLCIAGYIVYYFRYKLAEEYKFRYILNAVPVAIAITDVNGNILELNNELNNIFGYSYFYLIGKNVSIFVPNHLKDKHKIGFERMQNGEPIPAHLANKWFDTEGVRSDGTIFPISLSLIKFPLRGKIYYVALVKDISWRKNQEKQIVILNSILQTKLLASESFNQTVCHDLHAPLRIIDGFSEIIQQDYSHCLDDTGKDYIDKIRLATLKIRRLIEDMMRLSRLSNPELELTRCPFSLSELCLKIDNEYKNMCAGRVIESNIQKDMVVTGDEGLLNIVIRNLLDNAYKFTEHEPVTKIEVGSFIRDNKTIFFVKDNGVGFDMSNVDKLFKPFSRLNKKTDASGSGIGLTIVKRIIDLHGGCVWAESNQHDKQTVFYFTIGQ